MAVIFDIASEDSAMAQNALENAQKQQLLEKIASDPHGMSDFAALVSHWGDAAPTLPVGASVGLAQAGIGPYHPIGQKVIQSGLGLRPQPSVYEQRVLGLAPMGPQGVMGPMSSAQNFAMSGGTANMPQNAPVGADNPIGTPEDHPGSIYAPVGRFLSHVINSGQSAQGLLGSTTLAQAPGTPGAKTTKQFGSEAGFVPPSEAFKAITREAGAVANTGFQAVEMPIRVAAAATGALRGIQPGQEVMGPFGSRWHVGSIGDAFSPHQFTLYNQLVGGESLGTGILPGGPASETATKAQQQAASINGHALTYGRSIANLVASPDTRPYNVVSGMADFTVAMEADPASWIAKTVSDSVAASHLFSETTDASRAAVADRLIQGADTPDKIAGLEDWAGGGAHGGEVLRTAGAGLREAVIDRMRSDSMGMVNTAESLGIAMPRDIMRAAKAPQHGIFVGLRPILHRDSVLSYALSDRSVKDFQQLADENSFTRLSAIMPDVPAEVRAHIAEARSVQDIRFIVNDEMGLSIPGPGIKAVRSWEQTRLAAMLPDHFADLTDNNQSTETLDRLFRSANVDRATRDEILTKLATARTQAEAWDIYVNQGGKAIADKLTRDDKIGGMISAPGIPIEEAQKLTTFYPEQSALQHLYNMDASGRDARVTVGTVDGEAVPLTGPHLETELGRYVPSLNPVALRQATTKWRQAIRLWHDGYVTDAEGFAGGFSRKAHAAARAERFFMGQITGLWKTGVLTTLRLPLRIGAEEQAAASVAGLDSMWTNPVSTLSLIAGAKEGKLRDFLDKLPGIHASGSADVLNKEWAAFLGDRQSDYSRWLGRSADAVPSPWSTEQQILKHYTSYGKGIAADYQRGWIDELSHLHLDVPSREVARALLDPSYRPAGIEDGLDVIRVGTPGAEAVHQPNGAYYFTGKENPLGEGSGLAPQRLHVTPQNPLHVEGIERAGRGYMGAGEAAARKLLPREAFDELDRMIEARDVEGLINFARERGYGWSPEDVQRLRAEMSGGAGRSLPWDWVGAGEARRAGHDALVVSGQEYVALHPSALREHVTGLDAVKDWIKNGPGSKYLYDMQTGHSENPESYIEALKSGRMTPEQWVDSIAERVKTKTAGDNSLLHAVAYNDKSGPWQDTPFDFTRVNQGYKKSTSQEFRNYIKGAMDNGPEKVRALGTARVTSQPRAIEWFGDKMMGTLMDRPSKLITRSPMGRQFYYQEIQRMFSELTPEAQARALFQAESDGWKLHPTGGSGAADLEHVDMVAKARTLSKLHDYLYYPGERNTAEDMLRNLMPFAGAWHSALRRWSKLTIEHPQVLRRVQQGVQQLQSQGVFYKSEQGKEVFGIFGPHIMRELAGATGATMEGPVQGLNILGNGLPGPGLGAQIAAEFMIPKVSSTVAVRNFISPYGDPDFSGGWQNLVIPGWLQKMSAAQFQPLTAIPFVGDKVASVLSHLFPRTESQKIAVQDLAKQQFAAIAISGAYDLTNPTVFQQVVDKANRQALSMYFWRGLAQMSLPTAPTYSTTVIPKNGTAAGTAIMLSKIGADFRKMEKAAGGDYQKAQDQLVAKYGADAIYATEPQNLRTTYGVPSTIQGEAWQLAHPGFVKRYGNVWGYFAPSGGGFSQVVYHDEINRGLIQDTSLDVWAREASSHIGNMIYNQLRTAAGVSPSPLVQAQLKTYKAQLMKEYPGYNTTIPGAPNKPYSTEKIAEITQAVNDPSVARSPLAEAARGYLTLRQAVLDQSGAKSFRARAAEPWKAQLFTLGTQIATDNPDFANMWDGLFMNEVAPG